MEFLVTMTTHVPEGTPPEVVDDVRTREAARSRELAEQGTLLRLWRPPLQPGEWRALGLFAADDEDRLEEALASMPLRVWRTDRATVLTAHPNDPAGRAEQGPRGAAEFLTMFTIDIPRGVSAEAVDEAFGREAERTRELAEHGHLERLWMLLPDVAQPRALGLWRAPDTEGLDAILDSLPLQPWLSVDTTPLSAHPNDPAGRN